MYLLAGAWRESCVPTFYTRPEYPVGRRKNDLQRHYKNTTAKLTVHRLIYHKPIQPLDLTGHSNTFLPMRRPSRTTGCCARAWTVTSKKNPLMSNREALETELSVLEQLGAGAEFADHLPLLFPTTGAVMLTNQAQFHPLQFFSALSKSLHIYKHTLVRELIGTTAVTDRGRMHAEKIIVSTHFPCFLTSTAAIF